MLLKGTATSGTAADPTVPSGSILNNSGTVWIPIARIPISGITAGTPVMLVKQLPPMSQLWDSVTQLTMPPTALSDASLCVPSDRIVTIWETSSSTLVPMDIVGKRTAVAIRSSDRSPTSNGQHAPTRR